MGSLCGMRLRDTRHVMFSLLALRNLTYRPWRSAFLFFGYGIGVEVMKTGGLGGMFFSIARARFVYLQLLAAPRLARDVAAVAPQIEGKLVYLRTPAGAELAVRADGGVPSGDRAVGALPALAAGAWDD